MPYRFFSQNTWSNLSLARQFGLAGGVIMLLAMLGVGSWVSTRIERVVVSNTANATALYMESFIAPLTQNLTTDERLTEEARAAIGLGPQFAAHGLGQAMGEGHADAEGQLAAIFAQRRAERGDDPGQAVLGRTGGIVAHPTLKL